jgi:hypothetical protein
MTRYFLAAVLLAQMAVAQLAHSQEDWHFEKLDDSSVYEKATSESRLPAPSGIADMLMATGPEGGGIKAAWYGLPTSRYRHGALGDTIEGGMLVARQEDGRELRYRLPETEVFEDIAPRIADLDGDGASEIVTILSSIGHGASVTIFTVNGDALVRKATTGFIGRADRWLNIAAISNFTGHPTPEIAIVVTPHIGGTLVFLKYLNGSLRQFAAMKGFSNHILGTPELRLSAVADINNDGRADLALPADDRKSLIVVGFKPKGPEILARARFDPPIDKPTSPIDKPVGVEGSGLEAVFLVGTEDGEYYRTKR